ncbi:hypothetical protein JXA12_01070 [Candidatus Woesearchaeota archaeon]|nr:hypothetical protein [Candidatus Woesearchaeota archaeon]
MTPVTVLVIAIIAIAALWIGYLLGKYYGKLLSDRLWAEELPRIRADAAKRSRAVVGGQFSEQLAPFLPGFPYNPTEVRFLGKPVDFLVFKGMDEKEISEVVFVEVKSGKSRLSGVEKSLKTTIQGRKVSWKEYRVPEQVTREEP